MNKLLDGLAVSALHLFSWGLRRMSLERATALGRAAGRILFYFSGRRHVAYADLKAALGPDLDEKKRWQIIKGHYGKLGQMVVEMLRFPRLDRDEVNQRIHRNHWERYLEAVEKGRGVIALSAHFGNWELLQIAFGILGRPLHVLVRSQKCPRLNQYLNELRASHGSVTLMRGKGTRHLLRNLRRKELIGFLGDQGAGKSGGIIVPFFGRKTTLPTGAFELAYRTGAPILSFFIVNRDGIHHDIHVEEAQELKGSENREAAVEAGVRNYLATLENWIRRFPDEWLWGTKRWKYSWTKRVLILSDAKPGHFKQAEAVASQFQTIETQYGRPGMEYPVQTIQVHFKSRWHKILFSGFALFFIPFAQGRLERLKFFFAPETFKALCEASADFVISAGASLVPLNLCLGRDSRAKSIVLMKPSFPYNLFCYDLALVPAHDGGVVPPESLRRVLAPSRMERGEMEDAAVKLRKELKDPARVKIGIFLGGPTRRFQMELSDIEKLLESLRGLSESAGDYVLTTSRRTPDSVSQFLKTRLADHPACQMLVIGGEDTRSYVAPGMMALAEILIVSEDSISMISEAVASGKKVVVLKFGSDGLPAKHRRFHQILEREFAVAVSDPEELAEKIEGLKREPRPDLAARENERLQERLQRIL